MRMYTKEQTLNRLPKNTNINLLYKASIINNKGITKDTKEKYSEIIAKEILTNPTYDLTKIEQINRKRSYNVKHNGKFNIGSNRYEEIIAIKMLNKTYDYIGTVLNYQVPLKDKLHNIAGKIDLISKQDNTLYLIELKNTTSPETLLRCVLEIITYYHEVDISKLKEDYNLPSDLNVKPAILIFENTEPYKSLEDKFVNELIKKYDIKVFVANNDQDLKIQIKK